MGYPAGGVQAAVQALLDAWPSDKDWAASLPALAADASQLGPNHRQVQLLIGSPDGASAVCRPHTRVPVNMRIPGRVHAELIWRAAAKKEPCSLLTFGNSNIWQRAAVRKADSAAGVPLNSTKGVQWP